MPASGAVSGFGTLIQLSDGATPAVYTSIAEVTSIGGPGVKNTVIDVTHMESPDGYAEFISAQLADPGEITLGLNFILTNATQSGLIDNLSEQTAENIIRAYRIVWPDAATTLTATVDAGTNAWTTASAHGWNTAQPVKFTNAGGALPASTPQIVSGVFYFAARTGDDTFTLHPTSTDAVAGTNPIDFTGTGTGTHSVSSGTVFGFSAECTGFDPQSQTDRQLTAQVTLKVTGGVTITPA